MLVTAGSMDFGKEGAMSAIRVLLAGESWVSSSTHHKGWDFFSSTVYETGVAYLKEALSSAGMVFSHMPSHEAAERFPLSLQELKAWDAVILSDIGANTLLLHPETWLRGRSMPNRLELLKDYVADGGGLAMCGGYLSFAGIYASAKYYRTPIEEILPVGIHTFDDRVETPQGTRISVREPGHPVLEGIKGEWPALLGFNELVPKADATVLASVGEHPLLALRSFGKGRTLAWASDIGPHWCPESFAKWEGYARLMSQSVEWLAGRR
jgi:uncharacterized membrane protein